MYSRKEHESLYGLLLSLFKLPEAYQHAKKTRTSYLKQKKALIKAVIEWDNENNSKEPSRISIKDIL